MDPVKQALELSSQYGIVAVAFFMMAIFLGCLIIYVFKTNEKRESRYFDLVEHKLKESDDRTNKRHEEMLKSMAVLSDADRRQREEHEIILRNQSVKMDQNTKISAALDSIVARLSLKN